MDLSRIDKLEEFYEKESLKKNRMLLIDKIFYDINFNDIVIDIFGDYNRAYLKELYDNFAKIEEYFKNASYDKNVFSWSNKTNTNIDNLIIYIKELLKLDDSKELVSELIKKDKHFELLIYKYNSELDYDHQIFDVSFTEFKQLLNLQLKFPNDILVYNKLNQVIEYFSKIGATELIPYIRNYDNLAKLSAVLDSSVIRTRLEKEDIDKQETSFTINQDFSLSIISNANKLLNSRLSIIKQMLNSVDTMINSSLTKFLEKKSKSNKLYYTFRPLLLTKTFKKSKTDYVINFDDKIFEDVININFIELGHSKTTEEYLVETMISIFENKGLQLNYNQDYHLYYMIIENKPYYLNLDYALDRHELYTILPVIYPISLLNLAKSIDNEVDRVANSFYNKYISVKNTKKYYEKKELLFDTYDEYTKPFKSEKLEDLEKFLKALILEEGIIFKKDIITRIKTLTSYKTDKDFLELLNTKLTNMKNLCKENDTYYFNNVTFKIKDFKKFSDIPNFYLKEFLKIMKNNSFNLEIADYKKLFKFYLNLNLKEEDLVRVSEVLNVI